MRSLVISLFLLLAAALTACGDVATTEQLTDAQKQQLSEDQALADLIAEDYLPTELRTQEGKDPKILLVHCNGRCDKPPYSRDFPAVWVGIEKMPKAGEIGSVTITSVTLVTRRHAPDDERTTQRSCKESLSSLPTIQELRDVIAALVDEDGDIVAGRRITDESGLESWKCDYN